MTNAAVYIASDNIISPLGNTTAKNFSALAGGNSGIRLQDDSALSAQPFYAARFGSEAFCEGGSGWAIEFIPGRYTQFEKLLISSIDMALREGGMDAADGKTVLIISSTKGNIGMLEMAETGVSTERIALYHSAKLVADYFHCAHAPIVISNACISGVMAIMTASRLIQTGQYENAIVAGADLLSRFILSGFQSFQAISSRPCRPFDKSRDGITLGEGAATIVLSSNPSYSSGIRIMGGSTSNDANHLSAPSRTGEELSYSIKMALRQAGLSPTDIDFVSAHGTATIYNDEMEAKALTLSGLTSVPVNSLKGYYGHTLGAAGLIESIISAHSLTGNLLLPTPGFEQLGVTKPLNVCSDLVSVPLTSCLKTASGFGGCNAALVLSKS